MFYYLNFYIVLFFDTFLRLDYKRIFSPLYVIFGVVEGQQQQHVVRAQGPHDHLQLHQGGSVGEE